MATKAVKVKSDEPVVYDVKANSIRVYSSDDIIRYRIQLNTTIPGIRRNEVNGEYMETEIDYIDFVPAVLIAQCLEQIPGLDVIYTKKKEEGLRNGNSSGFGAAELQAVLRDAKISIERKKHVAGEEYTDRNAEVRTYEFDGYNTSITKIQLSQRMQIVLDKAIDSMFDL